MWHRKAMDKEIVKAMATKLSEIFVISVLKKHRNFHRRGLTHLDATPTFKNHPNTYGPHCTFSTNESTQIHNSSCDSPLIPTNSN